MSDADQQPAGEDPFAAKEPTEQFPPALQPKLEPKAAAAETKPAKVAKIRPGIDLVDDESPRPPIFSDEHMADEWIAENGNDWRYVAAYDAWYRWEGNRWRECETNLYFQHARDITRQAISWPGARDLTGPQRRYICSATMAANIIRLVRWDRRINATREQWNADNFMLATPGGVVDLRTGKTVEASREQYCSFSTTIAPEPGPHPLFDQVLGRAAKESPEMLAYLWRWLGYCLTGDVREESFLFLHGLGGSGKGTLVNTIAGILGDYAKTIPVDALIEQKNPRHSQEFARLRGARFVHAGESTEGARLNEGLVKLLTGGDKWVAHRMRMDDEEFAPTAKFLIHSNSKPTLRDIGESMRRRIHLIEYPGSIPAEQRDQTLKEKLKAEYPAILASMIRACLEWQQQGLGKPQQVLDDTEEYLRDNDTLGEWLAECCETGDHDSHWELSGEVYRRFSEWCKEQGDSHVISQKTLTSRLDQRGFYKKRTAAGRTIRGLRLKSKF